MRISRSGRIQAQVSGIRVSTSRVEALEIMASVQPIVNRYTGSPARRLLRLPLSVRVPGIGPAAERAAIPGERPLDVRWRYFSLTQVNSKDEGWTVWDAAGFGGARPPGLQGCRGGAPAGCIRRFPHGVAASAPRASAPTSTMSPSSSRWRRTRDWTSIAFARTSPTRRSCRRSSVTTGRLSPTTASSAPRPSYSAPGAAAYVRLSEPPDAAELGGDIRSSDRDRRPTSLASSRSSAP